jgi:class 3 adenylate cyclase
MYRRREPRGLTTMLFTDIVSSSEVAVELGDRRWRTLQAQHHAEVRRQLKRYGGREVDTAGDGFFATFSTPAAGIRCASAIVNAVRELGLDVRAGVHIGEAELTGEKVSGIAVTTAARVATAAGPGEILVTDTIVHLTAGAGFAFLDLGPRELKGWTVRSGRCATGSEPREPVG